MKFRPCIDLHNGTVKQIVGGSLRDGHEPQTNFTAIHSSAWFAKTYAADQLTGGHIIKLGPGNDDAAREALTAWPGGLQIGGGITAENAAAWLQAGADKVIVTSWLFTHGEIDNIKLDQLISEIGKEHIVIDLSCRIKDGRYHVVTDRWQTFSQTLVNGDTLHEMSHYAAEFLIHAVDVEGKQAGIDQPLIELLAAHSPIPCVYAGGIRSINDLTTIQSIGNGKIDVTIGSALDLFGGSLPYREVVAHCN
ncbi:MAG: phosphoribosylformimino-5-aminoimidazole carboxamide ribotide isomerase [Kiritimatiellaceae bacterium]|jgi:phosphoribosylformimino-5-aminoimidazole carboxamide ribotide isomerase|nr:phosphoribosylformimino-5-aminoimidazole carboxamide ribotide isomerase [Kiritimatiellaceae bacterium]